MDSYSHGQLNQRFGYLQVAHAAVFGDFAAIHGNLVTRIERRAMHAIFVDLIRQIVAFGQAESHVSKKFRDSREQADASYCVPLRLMEQRFHQLPSCAQAIGGRRYSDGTDFRQMHAVKMQRAATNDLAIFFCYNEVPHIFPQLRQRARQSVPLPEYARMIAWICSTSGRMALRVRTMGLLHGSQLFPGLFKRLLHAMRRCPTRNIMAGQNIFNRELLVNIGIKCRTEFTQFIER